MQSKTTSSIPSERHKISNILSIFFADEYASIPVGNIIAATFFKKF